MRRERSIGIGGAIFLALLLDLFLIGVVFAAVSVAR